jgi:hypothetical protein
VVANACKAVVTSSIICHTSLSCRICSSWFVSRLGCCKYPSGLCPSLHPVARQVPEPVLSKVASGKTVSDAELASLTYEQRAAVRDAQLSASAQKVGTGAATVIAGGFSIFVIVASFVSGLLGWLLIMRKRVLRVRKWSSRYKWLEQRAPKRAGRECLARRNSMSGSSRCQW